jgi:hypothetical protein
MDDNELLTEVRKVFAGVRMSTESGAILADGNSLRRRRRLGYGAGVAALAAVTAISGVTLTAGSSPTSTAQLTAWTVQKEANGTIDVTIHDLLNLKGLAQELKADGVPAEVVSEKPYPAACVDYPAMTADMASVITLGSEVPDDYVFVIHPAGIPSGTKLLLNITTLQPTSHGTSGGVGDKLWGFGAMNLIGSGVAANMGLVHDTGSC